MQESDFEGTLVLEKMAEIGKLDEFWEAIDSDDLSSLKRLMRQAGVNSETVQNVLTLVQDGN